jgi:DNA repair photolyase
MPLHKRPPKHNTPGEQLVTVPFLTVDQRKGMDLRLLNPVDYRKSGLSLNHIVGCPLDCAYCVRHLFGNFEMKRPHLMMSDAEAVDLLVSHQLFRADLTPIQLLNRATDPFLPGVKPHLFEVLRRLDAKGLHNHVLIITRWRVSPEDCDLMNSFVNIRLTLLFTYSGISDTRIEPVDSQVAATSLRIAHERASRYRTVLYWRPLIPGFNDSPEHLRAAAELSRDAHATAFTGLFFRDEIRGFYRKHGLPEPYQITARRKILPETLEDRVLEVFADHPHAGTLFRKTSCAVAFAHGLADYNGHYGIRELCNICPADQQARCAAAQRRPSAERVRALAKRLGLTQSFAVGERAVEVDGLDEQRRYYLQHSLGFQVHNSRFPHRFRRHGRAEIGWEPRHDDVADR